MLKMIERVHQLCSCAVEGTCTGRRQETVIFLLSIFFFSPSKKTHVDAKHGSIAMILSLLILRSTGRRYMNQSVGPGHANERREVGVGWEKEDGKE